MLCYTLSFPTFHNSQAKPSLRNLVQFVKVTNWFDLGLELQIDSYHLEVIQADEKGVQAQTRAMFQKWLEICTTPSWEAILRALIEINENTLAVQVATKLNLRME